jgi:hypothetical protein
MKNFFYTFLFILLSCHLSFTQSYLEISTGAGYNNQQYIRLSDEKLTSVKLTDWDIAFTSFGTQDAGVLFNEAAGVSFGQPPTEIEVYDTKSSDFDKVFVLDSVKANRLYNDEKSWSYGAFNSTRDVTKPFDYGWGSYVPTSMKVVGGRVFLIKLKSGKIIKFTVSDLSGYTYNFKYADLNNDNLVSKSVNKNPGKQTMLYYSFTKSDFVNIAPTDGYDLIFTRYTSLIPNPGNPGTFEQYNVTGILTAPAASTYVVNTSNPDSAKVDASTVFSKQTDLIGFDWKSFANNQWLIDLNKVYFIKSPVNDHIYKLRFIDFGGSSTGTATMEKTDLGVLTSSKDLPKASLGIFPNPTTDRINVIIENTDMTVNKITLCIHDMSGKSIITVNCPLNSGLNSHEIDISNMEVGTYSLSVIANNKVIANKAIIKK